MKSVTHSETIWIRGESFFVKGTLHQCARCLETISADEQDAFELAKALYREKHDFFSAEELQDYQAAHGLTREELAAALGVDLVTVNRYCQGTLPLAEHNDRFKGLVEQEST